MKVAIVGAGISGLACAAQLKRNGMDAVLFDKGKRPGGRLSTLQLGEMAWDFGCQYVMPGGPDFAQQIQAWSEAGLLVRWPEGPEGALIGVPGMSVLVAAQCEAHDVRFNALVQGMERDGHNWFVSGAGFRDGAYTAVVIATPAEQAASLLSLHDFEMAREAVSARSHPCWTAMVAFDQPITNLPAYIQDCGPIARAARNNSKPGRGSAECWVIQADADWSQRHLECDAGEVADKLLMLLQEENGVQLPAPCFLKAHRWRFGSAFGQHKATFWNPAILLGACGEWCVASNVEGAWRSGVELADKISGTHVSLSDSRKSA
jgi:renalase